MPAQPAVLVPLLVGAGAVVITIAIHSAALSATVAFVRREHRSGHAGAGFWVDVAIAAVVIVLALAAHLFGMIVWAQLNYTTLGYGDVVMTPSWRLLGPLEAATGSLMFGASTAIIVAVIQGLIRSRLGELKH